MIKIFDNYFIKNDGGKRYGNGHTSIKLYFILTYKFDNYCPPTI